MLLIGKTGKFTTFAEKRKNDSFSQMKTTELSYNFVFQKMFHKVDKTAQFKLFI